MRYQYRIAFAIVSVVALAAADALAAGPGIFRFRAGSGGQSATRTYRSYSVSPATPVPAEGTRVFEEGESMSRPAAVSQPRRSTKSKPSYMRADSKASGRFGQ